LQRACRVRSWSRSAYTVAILAAAAASRVPFDFFVKRVWLGIPFFAGIVVIPAIFFVPGARLFDLPLGPVHLAPSIPGLIGAVLFIARVGVSVSLAVLLVLTTPWADLLKSLQAIRVPQLFVLILAMAYRYIFLFLHLASGMFEARKSRIIARTSGGEQRRWISGTMGNLLNRSVKMSNDVYAAMAARGFTGSIRSFSAYRMRPAIGSRWPGRDGCGRRRGCQPEPVVTAEPVPVEPVPQPRGVVFELHGVRYLYAGRQTALDGIDLRIEQGERVVSWVRTDRASRRC